MNSFAAVLSFSWASIGTAVADHLWQSTVFVVLAAVLTLALKENQARVRYWLWLAASLKFLLPFSVLVLLGSRLHGSKAPANPRADLSIVIEQIGQPFSSSAVSHLPSATHSTSYALAVRMLPVCLLTLWLVGFVATLVIWYLRWWRTRVSIRGAQPVISGREVEALRRLERLAAIERPTHLVVSTAGMEPGIVGIFRPVMFLPTGIPDRLTDSELAAIIAHELCHVIRRDNLTAAIQMLVEAVFWFHPIVFWIGARMIAERERACDEEVLALGSDPQIYAEGILKVCKFYLETPLACVAGVTGSNLKKRIEAIMIHRIAHKLELGKKLLLAALAAAALIAPVVFGLFHPAQGLAQTAQTSGAPTPGFESVSIQPNINGKPMPPFNIVAGPDGNFVGFKFSNSTFLATHATLPNLVRMAYGVLPFQVTGGPDWLSQEKYDVNAKFLNGLEDAKFWSLPQEEQTSRMDQRRLELQALLADRFRLVVHRETRQLPVYSLTIAANGPNLQKASPGDTYANGFKLRNGTVMGAGVWVPQSGVLLGQGVSMVALAAHLSQQLGRVIVDNTGLSGKYDFKLQFAPGRDESASLLSAMPEQLGLQLTPQDGPVEMIVIDRAEPAETVAETANLLNPVAAQMSPQAGSQSSFAFDSVSIKPKGAAPDGPYRARVFWNPGIADFENQSFAALLQFAYNVDGSQVSGGPAWVHSDLYDLTLKTHDPLQGDALRAQLQKIIAERFKLVLHRELKPLPVYELVAASGGPKLTEAHPGEHAGDAVKVENGKIVVQAGKIKELVDYLRLRTGKPVIDKTGLTAAYDFTLTVEGEGALRKLGQGNDNSALFKAMAEQLGLELIPSTDQIEVLVIDHAEPVSGEQKDLARNR